MFYNCITKQGLTQLETPTGTKKLALKVNKARVTPALAAAFAGDIRPAHLPLVAAFHLDLQCVVLAQRSASQKSLLRERSCWLPTPCVGCLR